MTYSVRLNPEQTRNFDRVIDTAKQLDYKVSVTGGAFITHEIKCSLEEYRAIYELANDIVS